MTAHAERPTGKALTAVSVRNAKEPGKYHDGGGMGLYLRVEPTGARYWVQRITIRGKRREIGLGSPPVVSLADARDEALKNKRAARMGADPLQEKRDVQAVLTFADAARKVHEIHTPTWSNPKHAAQFISTLETYTFPKLGKRKVGDIASADVLAVLQPIWLDKPETARRVRQRIGMVMKWAVANGWRADNPAENIGQALPKHTRVKAHRKALPYAEVAGCIDAVQQSDAWAATKLALEFTVLTASRSGEVRGALWSEINFDRAGGAIWEVPASRMKMKRAHRMPLSRRALEILRDAEALQGASGLVFPSARDKPLSDMTLSKLVKALGFDADVHGFRTSFRTWAQEQTNFPREVAEAALAHVIRDKSEAAYARSDLFVKRGKMMDAWAAYLVVKRGEVVKLA